jgi:hypothetical protein
MRPDFKFFIPWQPPRISRGTAGLYRLFADPDVPDCVVRHLREKHRLPVVTAEDAGMRSASDERIFEYCSRNGLILVSFNVKDFWRMPVQRSGGMFLVDVDKAHNRDVRLALDQFFRHNGRVGRYQYTRGAIRLTTQGYVMKYQLYPNPEVHQVEAQYRGNRLFANYMAFPS